jgi:hypothetical protein
VEEAMQRELSASLARQATFQGVASEGMLTESKEQEKKPDASAAAAMESDQVPTNLEVLIAQNGRLAREIVIKKMQYDRLQQDLVNSPSILAAQNEEMALKRMQHDRIGQDTTHEQAMARTRQPKMSHGITLNHALTTKLMNNASILRHIRNIQFIQKRMLALQETDLTGHVTPEELIMINRTNERSAAMAFLSTEEFLRYRMDEIEEERAAAMALLHLH